MLRIQNLTVDCSDPVRLAAFWAEVLGWQVTYESDVEAVVVPVPEGVPFVATAGDVSVPFPDLLFLRTPDTKAVKNRLHLCLRPDDQAAEVQRLEALGATLAEVGQSADPDTTWVVMADLEGNEFCVLSARPTQ